MLHGIFIDYFYHKFMVNVGKYSIHGAFMGLWKFASFSCPKASHSEEVCWRESTQLAERSRILFLAQGDMLTIDVIIKSSKGSIVI